MFSKYQKKQALKLYDQSQSVTKVIQCLGYPTRQALYNWIAASNAVTKQKTPRKKWNNTSEHPLHPSAAIKMEAIRRCFEHGENVQLVSEEIGYTRSSIYTWRKKYMQRGAAALMNPKDDPRGIVPEGEQVSLKEVDKLRNQILNMQLEIDILKETLDLLKKDPGVDMTALKS